MIWYSRSWIVLLVMSFTMSMSSVAVGAPVTTQGVPDFFAQANKAYDSGDYKSAVTLYRTAVREGQFEVFSWFNMGNALVHLDKPHLAAVAYRRASELAPGFSRPWVMLGDLEFIGEDFGSAIASYQRSMELGESSAHIEHALGECFLRSGEITEAERHLEKAVTLDPDRIGAWYALSEAYERLEDYPNAVQVLQKAILASPTAGADVHFSLASLYLRMGDTAKAEFSLEDGLSLQPGNANARRFLASLYQESGSPWMGVFTLEAGLDRVSAKDVPDLRIDLAELYFGQGRYPEALDQYLSAWKAGDPRGRTGAENVAAVYHNAGDSVMEEKTLERIRVARK